MSAGRIYSFGVFSFETATRELRRDGRVIGLEPQPARALEMLIARAGEVVTRDELKGAVWGTDTHVDFDRGLAYVISQIRNALGDSADNPRFVQTLPRRGYRFVAPVHAPHGDAVSAAPPPSSSATDAHLSPTRVTAGYGTWAAVAAVVIASGAWGVWQQSSADRAPVVAVSVFDNETGIPEHDRLVAALSDVVVTHLTQFDEPDLAVVGNAAVLRRPRNIRNLQTLREELRADYVLLGQLQTAPTGLRFITHFIRLSDEAHLRANRLEFPDGDLSRLEPYVVAEFARAIREHLSDGDAQ